MKWMISLDPLHLFWHRKLDFSHIFLARVQESRRCCSVPLENYSWDTKRAHDKKKF